MIIWKGWGILALIIPLLCSLLIEEGFNVVLGAGFYKASAWGMPLVLVLSALLVYFVGYKLNNRQGRVLIDPKNNEMVELKTTHSMFWIPLQYWSFIIVGVAIWMYLANIGIIYHK
ncbi:MAG: hypothetical protein R3331_11210 [Sulfurospirillaceae bacterium]|nr:hypothetical protein [Sulfurospirillaceae bacterium]